MTHNDTDTTVSEYLADVAHRVSDLPLLQRRELLADLESHIEAERIERNAESPGQLLEILERLGSPEEIAAAARAEAPAGASPPPVPAAPRRRPGVVVAVVVTAVVLLLFLIVAVLSFFVSGGESSEPAFPAPLPGQSALPTPDDPPAPLESAPR